MYLEHTYDGHGNCTAECLACKYLALETRKTELEAEVAELRKDKARLDWMIEHSSATVMQRGNGQVAVYFGPQPSTPWCSTQRGAIDAAMASK